MAYESPDCSFLNLKEFSRKGAKSQRRLSLAALRLCVKLWLFAARIEGADGVAEVFAEVGREHGAHAEFAGGEVACEAADVQCRDGSRDRIGALLQRAVGLREKAGDEAG